MQSNYFVLGFFGFMLPTLKMNPISPTNYSGSNFPFLDFCPPKESYQSVLRQIEMKRLLFRSRLDSARNVQLRSSILNEAGLFLSEAITSKITPHWHGTPWAFDGHTEVPGKGAIACGYFVSTVLLHAGFRINRYKMAQQRPTLEVATLHQKPGFIEYPNVQIAKLADSIRSNLKDGVYIFGQQFHVGFMHLERNKISLIHSCYLGNTPCVLSEDIFHSKILSDGSYIFFGEITTNHKLVEQWLTFTPIKIYTD